MKHLAYAALILCFAFLSEVVEAQTIDVAYFNGPASGTVLKADETFTLDLAMRPNGNNVKAFNIRFESDPVDMVFPTNVSFNSCTGGSNETYIDLTTSRIFVYCASGVTSGSPVSGQPGYYNIATVTFQVTQCPAFDAANVKINPISIATDNGSIQEAQQIAENDFALSVEIKECFPPEPPEEEENPLLGEGSFETTEFEENANTTSTGIAGCSAGSSVDDANGAMASSLILLGLVLFSLGLIRIRSAWWLPLFVVGFAISGSHADARIYVVDGATGCSGASCRGDFQNPFVSLSECFNNVRFEPGDEVYIRNGTYNESVDITVNVNGNGRLGLPIRIRGESNNNTILNGGGDPALVFQYLTSFYTVENLRFRNGGDKVITGNVTVPPASLMYYLVGQGMNVLDNRFDGSVSGSVGKSAIHLSGSSSLLPTSLADGHLVKGNEIAETFGLGLSGSQSTGIQVVNFDNSILQNNQVIFSSLGNAPQSSIRVNGSDGSIIERNAFLNIVDTDGNTAQGAVLLSSANDLSFRNNLVFARLESVGATGNDKFMGAVVIDGSASLGTRVRMHHNTIAVSTNSPGTNDSRYTAPFIMTYYASAYSDWVNNIVTSFGAGDHPHFLWTGGWISNDGANRTKRHFMDHNTLSDRFFADLPGPCDAVLGSDRMDPNTLHDIINTEADVGVVCEEISTTMTLPACKKRDNVAYAGFPGGVSSDWYNIDLPFDDPMCSAGTQTFADFNAQHAGNLLSGNPYDPATYNGVTYANGAGGQSRCSEFDGIQGGSGDQCDNISGAFGGSDNKTHYDSTYTLSLCGPDTTKQLDPFPTYADPDRRLTAADYLALKEGHDGEGPDDTRADKVGNYLVTLDENQLTCN